MPYMYFYAECLSTQVETQFFLDLYSKGFTPVESNMVFKYSPYKSDLYLVCLPLATKTRGLKEQKSWPVWTVTSAHKKSK